MQLARIDKELNTMNPARKMILSVSLCILLISALVPVAWAEDELAVVGSADYETTTDKNAQETLTASVTTGQQIATSNQSPEAFAIPTPNRDQSTATIPQDTEEPREEIPNSDFESSNGEDLAEQSTEEIQTQDAAEATPDWSSIGSCEWKVEDGCVILRPIGSAEVGYLPNGVELYYSWPWETAHESDHFKIEGKIVCGDTASDMFYGFNNLKSIEGLSNLDTSNVVSMSRMFANCSSLTSVNLSSFDTSNVTDMNSMFLGCASLRTVDVSSFDTSSVIDFGAMFERCSSLFSIDLTSFNTLKGTKMDMFNDCPSLEILELGPKCTMQRELPDKIWYNAAGEAFTPSTMPIGIAMSYASSKELLEPLRIQLNETNKTLSADAAPFTLVATVTPEWKAGSITWSTSDAAVATVDSNGQITVHSPGKATITAESDGATANCRLTVLPIEAEEPDKPGDDKPSEEKPPLSSNENSSSDNSETEDPSNANNTNDSTHTKLAQTGDRVEYFSFYS